MQIDDADDKLDLNLLDVVDETEEKVKEDKKIQEQIKLEEKEEKEDKKKEEINTIINSQDIKDFYEYTEECFKRASKVVYPSIIEIKDFLFDLPLKDEMEAQGKKLCVWDLDETLIHCDQENPEEAEVQIDVKFPKKSKRVSIIIIINRSA